MEACHDYHDYQDYQDYQNYKNIKFGLSSSLIWPQLNQNPPKKLVEKRKKYLPEKFECNLGPGLWGPMQLVTWVFETFHFITKF